MLQTSKVLHQGIHQSLPETVMFGLILHVELLVIFRVVNCYIVPKGSVWMIQGCSRYSRYL
jgi:hypothetical protein